MSESTTRPKAMSVVSVTTVLTAIAVGLTVTRPALAVEEASLYVMTDWPAVNCSWHYPKDEWDDMLSLWYWRMNADSNWAGDQYYVDSPIVEGWFSDEVVDPANGNDDSYLDDADAAMYGGHGGYAIISSSRYWKGYMREMDSTGNSETCQLMSYEMLLGGTDDGHDLEFLHLSSCNSLTYDTTVTNDTWETWEQVFTSTTDEAGLHQLEGFHGHMIIHDYLNVDYMRVAQDGLADSVAAAWIDNLFIQGAPGDDICPVAMVAGNTGRLAGLRLSLESYNSGFSDPDDSPGFARAWVGGCDPIDAEELPEY